MANSTAISPAGRMINCRVSAVIWGATPPRGRSPCSRPRITVGHGYADRDHRAESLMRDGGAQAAGECIKPTGAPRYAFWWPTPAARARRAPSAPPGTTAYTPVLVTRRPAVGCLLEIVETLVLTLIIFFVIQTFVAQPYQIRQQSMETTLEPDQYVLVDKLTPRFDTYKRGDIVVFNPPEAWQQENGTPYIKRVIGVGGDTVEIHDGK